MEDDKLDLFWHALLIVMAISNALICIFGSYQIIVWFYVALVTFALAFITWIVLLIVKMVRFRKQVKKWEQGHY